MFLKDREGSVTSHAKSVKSVFLTSLFNNNYSWIIYFYLVIHLYRVGDDTKIGLLLQQ